MGLKGDISEVKEAWARAGWRVRVYLVLSAFLASSSLASLAETIVKWKGFVLTGLAFYQEYIRHPVHLALSSIGLAHFPRHGIDAIILFYLAFSAQLHAEAYVHKYSCSPTKLFLVSSLRMLVQIIPWFLLIAVLGDEAAKGYLTIVIITYCVVVLWVFVGWKNPANQLFATRLLVPPIIVCVLAAVNIGLS